MQAALQNRWIWGMLCLVPTLCVALVACVYACTGVVFVNHAIPDFFIEVETSWRATSGLHPYTDFITPVGPIFYALYAGLGHFGLVGPWSVPFINMLPVAILAPWIVRLCARRLSPSVAVWLTVFFALRTVSSRFVGDSAFMSSFLAPYNPLAVWLLFPVLVAALLPRKESMAAPRVSDYWEEGLGIGLCVLGLLGLKFHVAGIACLALVIGAWGHRTWRIPASIAVGVTVLGAGTWSALHLAQCVGYFQDMQYVAHANDWVHRCVLKLVTVIAREPDYVAITIWALYTGRLVATPTWRGRICAWTLCCAPWAVVINNYEDLPILWAVPAAWIFYKGSSALSMTSATDRPVAGASARYQANLRWAAVWVPMLIIVGWNAVSDGVALVAYPVFAHRAPTIAIQGDTQHPMHLQGFDSHVLALNTALHMVHAHGLDHSKVIAMMPSNIFPFLMHTLPPRGSMAWWDLNRTYTATVHPVAVEVFGDAAAILKPDIQIEHPVRTDSTDFWRMYAPYIARNFHETERGSGWVLYQRNVNSVTEAPSVLVP